MVGAAQLPDDRRFGELRKSVDRVRLGAHLGEEAIDVGAFGHPHDARRHAFARIAADLLHVVHPVHCLFDGQA